MMPLSGGAWLAVLLIMAALTMLGSIGAIFLKRGSAAFRLHVPSLLRNKPFIFGGLLYALSAAGYVVLLRYLPLSLAYPLTSMSYVWVALLSTKYLNERVDKWRWTGIGLIVLGIVLLSQ